MTKEEKAQYMQQKREKELTEREAAITRKELMAEAKNTLAREGLPQELAEVLDYSDADSCKKSMGESQRSVPGGCRDCCGGKTERRHATEKSTRR